MPDDHCDIIVIGGGALAQRPIYPWPKLTERDLYLGKDIPIRGTAHQAGTLPASSVIDRECRAHEPDECGITDASFFPSIGARTLRAAIIEQRVA